MQRQRRIGGDLFQQPHQPLRQALGRSPIEQIGAVFELAREPSRLARRVLRFREAEGQIELGRASANRQRGRA